MRADQARTIDISNYLQYVEGIVPAKTRLNGRELWYRSPIRDGDQTPSFKVDTVLNLWYDHGALIGGNVLDLVIEIRQCTVKEALSILERSGLYQGGTFTASSRPRYGNHRQRQIRPSPKNELAGEKGKSIPMQLLAVSSLSNPILIDYIRSRGIDISIAKQYLEEIAFKPQDKLVQYYALGFASGDGYEVRNKYFKGFVGTNKTVSLLNVQQGNDLVVFEGFIDFLSYLTYLKQHKKTTELNVSVAVMNSVAMKNQLIELIEQHDFKTIYCFLDNDDAGRITLDSLHLALPDKSIIDKSDLYAEHKDFNAWLIKL